MNREFPIMPPSTTKREQPCIEAGVMIRSIPWEIIAPHEEQALTNHGQTLKQLAYRCGLSACEAVAILEDRRWKAMDDIDAYKRLAELVGTR